MHVIWRKTWEWKTGYVRFEIVKACGLGLVITHEFAWAYVGPFFAEVIWR